MKYYLGKIGETNGGMEYDAQYLFSTNGKPEKYADKVAMEWRGCRKSDYDKSDGGYWADCTLVYDNGVKEIPAEDFEVLKKYIPVM